MTKIQLKVGTENAYPVVKEIQSMTIGLSETKGIVGKQMVIVPFDKVVASNGDFVLTNNGIKIPANVNTVLITGVTQVGGGVSWTVTNVFKKDENGYEQLLANFNSGNEWWSQNNFSFIYPVSEGDIIYLKVEKNLNEGGQVQAGQTFLTLIQMS